MNGRVLTSLLVPTPSERPLLNVAALSRAPLSVLPLAETSYLSFIVEFPRREALNSRERVFNRDCLIPHLPSFSLYYLEARDPLSG